MEHDYDGLKHGHDPRFEETQKVGNIKIDFADGTEMIELEKASFILRWDVVVDILLMCELMDGGRVIDSEGEMAAKALSMSTSKLNAFHTSVIPGS